MAAVVDSIVSFTIEKIGELLIQQAGYSYGVRKKVESIQKDLTWMKCFLRDADRRLGGGDQRLKNLVADVWSVARRVEDAIDMLRLREETRQSRGRIKKCIYALTDFMCFRQIGETIDAIKKEISEIRDLKMIYGTPEVDGGEGPSYVSRKLQDYRRAAALALGEEVVGFAKDADALVERLITGGGAGDSRRCRVVSIVATGGAGKTTLANKVYKSDDARNHFGDSVAWVCVSQNYSAKHLLQEIAAKFLSMSKQDSESLCEKELQERLSEFLRHKRYLVVLDDMWDTDAWDQLKAAFPDTKNGSRIILTTRNQRVALHADPDPANPPYRLPLLNPDDSWKLFLKKAFPWESTAEIPCLSSSELVDVGKQIVAKCGGLPLAISVVGGILAAKGEANVKDWRNVLARLKAELSGSEAAHCGDIIALSYYDLPYHLKPCFLCLGLFPEDYKIPTGKLKMLWIAERFIQPMEGQEKEDLAEDYLVELIGRNLIQVVERGLYRPTLEETCRIHDVLHAFAIAEGKQYKFLEIYSAVSPPASTKTEARWLAIHGEALVSLNNSTPNVRSLLCFGHRRNVEGVELPRTQEPVVHFLRSPLELIGELTHLRYLNLESIFLPFLTRSIGNMNHLETLLLPFGVKLPEEIWRIHRLKHLEAPECQFEGEPRLDNLKNILTLTLGSGNWIGEKKNLSSLGGLRNLKIGLMSVSDSMMMEGIGSLIGKLVNLQLFQLIGSLEFFALAVHGPQSIGNAVIVPSLRHHLNLLELHLTGRLKSLPELPETLAKLSLSFSDLREDPMPTLETLPNLRLLHMCCAYTGKRMTSSAHGFRQLKRLKIEQFSELGELAMEQGAMPKLEFLEIHHCGNLRKLSDGLRCIAALKKFSITNPSVELENWLQKANEEAWYKNQHIKTSSAQIQKIIYSSKMP